MLDIDDHNNIDINRFSNSAYIQPGKYMMKWYMNKIQMPEIEFIISDSDNNNSPSSVCFTAENISKIALTKEAIEHLEWYNDCLDLSSLSGSTYNIDISTLSLYFQIPKNLLEYTDEYWDSPSLWDSGINGALLDYNINSRVNYPNGNYNSYAVNANGVAGFNLGTWRARTEWQAEIQHDTGSNLPINRSIKWNQFHAYREIKALKSKLILGEDYLDSNLFEIFRYIGVSLRTDINMLPPNLRDFAPEVTGIAKTNAQVTISQQGKLIYQTQVPAGAFIINNIPSYTNGILDVKIEELDGSIQEYKINAKSSPYLTRPGSVRYKLATGKVSSDDYHYQDPFVAGELSWGLTNSLSMFSGLIGSNNYKSIAIGLGQNLFSFGALSFDITKSIANKSNNESEKGSTYRVNYIKQLVDLDAQIHISAMRYSDNFMTMSDLTNYNYSYVSNNNSHKMKGFYSLSLNKRHDTQRISTTFTYTDRTYWNKSNDTRYDATLSKYFDLGDYKNISLNFTGYSSKFEKYRDKGAYLNISIPWGNYSSINYNTNINADNKVSHMVGVFNRIDDETNYRLNLGHRSNKFIGSSFINHDASHAKINASSSFAESEYLAFGLSAQGGVTITKEGGAFHRTGIPGSTRILVDTDGVQAIPVKGYGASAYSNIFGKIVIPEVRSYYRNKISINLDEMPNNADVIDTVDTATLTEGAIGYRKFKVNSGLKMMVIIKLENGNNPPFGAEIYNRKGVNTGIIGESGLTYLSGINADEIMTIGKNTHSLCAIQIPNDLASINHSMLLICKDENKQSF